MREADQREKAESNEEGAPQKRRGWECTHCNNHPQKSFIRPARVFSVIICLKVHLRGGFTWNSPEFSGHEDPRGGA